MKDRLRASWRRETLCLGLAAMECCWLYPWHTFLLGASAQGQRIPLAALLTLLLLALYVTRLLNQSPVTLLLQRTLSIVLALLSALLLLRLYVYVDYRFTDLSWLGQFLWEVGNILQRIPSALAIFFSGLYLWWRGIHLAQRDLSVESAGFSFRVGIIAFLWLFLAGIVIHTIDALPYAFLYFFLGLIVMGLARIEDVSQSHVGIRSPFNASWLVILAGSTLGISALSILAVGLFSFRNFGTLMQQLAPLLAWVWRLTRPLQVMAAWLLELLLTFLIRAFGAAFGAEGQESSPLSQIAKQLQEFQQLQPARGVPLILRVVQWAGLGLLFIATLALLALSITRGRRMLQEGRSVEHESVWDAENAAEGVQEAMGSRWRTLREEWRARLATLRGEEYSLASVRQTYASLVKLATASGFPRHKAETPYEYVTALRRAFPGSEKEIQLITDAYVRAHYGQRSFRSPYVQRVRAAWLTIRARQEQSRQ